MDWPAPLEYEALLGRRAGETETGGVWGERETAARSSGAGGDCWQDGKLGPAEPVALPSRPVPWAPGSSQPHPPRDGSPQEHEGH